MSMSPGSKAGVGAALQTVGQGLMQYTQFSIEEQRQKNLEAIRQRERGEDKSERDARYGVEDQRHAGEVAHRDARDKADDEFKTKTLAAQERARIDAAKAEAARRGDAKEMKAIEMYVGLDKAFEKARLEIDAAERAGTTTPEVAAQQRTRLEIQLEAKQQEMIRLSPSLKGLTVSDYLTGDGEKPTAAPAAATALGQPTLEKKPLPAIGLMKRPPEGEPDPAAAAIAAAGLKPVKPASEQIKGAYQATVTAASDVIGAVGAKNREWLLSDEVPDVMRKIRRGNAIDPAVVGRLADSGATEAELRAVGADSKLIGIINSIRSGQ